MIHRLLYTIRLPDNGIFGFTDYGNNTPHIPTPPSPLYTPASPGISAPPRFVSVSGDSVGSISQALRVATSRPSSGAHYTDYE